MNHSELEGDNVLEMFVTEPHQPLSLGDRDRPGAHALDPRYRSRAGRRRRSVLADCLVIRESLDQARVEIQRAISSVRDRLDGTADRIDGSTSVAGVGSNGGDSR